MSGHKGGTTDDGLRLALAREIAHWVADNHLTQERAAWVLCMRQTDVSHIVHQNVRGYSLTVLYRAWCRAVAPDP
jgi:predicted XRE-type DNA-binding protein